MGSMVEAGNKTGIYYVLLCGISRRATWKDVKDHARSFDLEVDHVEIYQNDIGGWVRVLSIEDFRKACDIFNGATIHGMAIQADARNEYQQVPLRYPPPPCSASSFKSTSPTFTNQSSLLTDMQSLSVSEYDYSMPPYGVPHDFVSQHIDTSYPCAFNSQIPLPTYTYSVPAIPPLDRIPRQANIVQTERRKILIKRLPSNMLGRDVEELIKWRFNDDPYISSGIEAVEMPASRDGKFRGHAYVLMQSFQLATEVVNGLDGLDYQNNKLEVKLAKEGEIRNTTSSSKKSDKHSSHTTKSTKSEKEKSSPESHDKIRRSVTPAIANGSGTSSRKHRKP